MIQRCCDKCHSPLTEDNKFMTNGMVVSPLHVGIATPARPAMACHTLQLALVVNHRGVQFNDLCINCVITAISARFDELLKSQLSPGAA